MATKLYNMPLSLLTDEQIKKVVKDAIKQERKLKRLEKCKKLIPEEKFFKLAKAHNDEPMQIR